MDPRLQSIDREDEEPPRGVLRFRLEKRVYLIESRATAGLLETREIHPIPGAPDGVLGLVVWRGRPLTVLDLPRILGDRSAGESPCLLRLASPFESVALYLPAGIHMSSLPLEIDACDAPQGLVAVRCVEGRAYLLVPDRIVARVASGKAG